MKSAQGFPAYRIALAVALSILAHSLLLWQLPKIEWPAKKQELPRLQAKLEALPKLAKKSISRKPSAKHLASPPPPMAEPVVATAPEISDAAASSVAAEATEAADIVPANSVSEALPSQPLLPKKAQLRFAVQYGGGTFKVGEIIHNLENSDGRYILRATTQTTGLVSLFKSFHLSQTSSGSVSRQGLRPDSYVEVKTEGSGTQTSTASFDWGAHKVSFNNGKEVTLAEQAQDILSLPYHLSQLPLNAQGFQIALSNGRNINQYYIALGEEGSISTAMGELRTVALSKVHGANEEGLVIWLALEYRLLPVKILYLDKSGEISANMVITDIRVSDE